MSALTDLFTSMANKIRSKTGTATTYTPTEMVSDGIDDVYDAGYADATTPITPSNSSPASMTANTGYKPTANGYAIASQPTSITPSNDSPVWVAADTIYRTTDIGFVIKTYNSVIPSDSSPVAVAQGNIYKISFSSGHLYKTNTNFKYGTVADKNTASEEFSIDTGLSNIKKFVMWGWQDTKSRVPVLIYDEDMLGSGYFASATIQTSAVAQKPKVAIGTNPTQYNCSIMSVSGGTVTVKQASNADNIFKIRIQWVAHS